MREAGVFVGHRELVVKVETERAGEKTKAIVGECM